MNGRMYDPIVGRFLSPDPYVQMPDFSQSYNRYAYCLNNPLVYTDPSGEKLKWWSWWALGDLLTGGMVTATMTTTAAATVATAGIPASDAAPAMLATAATTVAATVPTVGIPLLSSASMMPLTAPLAKSTASFIDFNVIFWGTLFKGDPKWGADRFGNWLKIEAGLFFHIPGWETDQALLGNAVSHFRNMIGHVDDVTFDWKTFSVLVNRDDADPNASGYGYTFGPYINSRNLEVNDKTHNHEKGHTIQSRLLGPLYLSKVAIPSGLSYWLGSTEYHDNSWYEVWANRLMDIPESESFPNKYRYNKNKGNYPWYWPLVVGLPFFPH